MAKGRYIATVGLVALLGCAEQPVPQDSDVARLPSHVMQSDRAVPAAGSRPDVGQRQYEVAMFYGRLETEVFNVWYDVQQGRAMVLPVFNYSKGPLTTITGDPETVHDATLQPGYLTVTGSVVSQQVNGDVGMLVKLEHCAADGSSTAATVSYVVPDPYVHQSVDVTIPIPSSIVRKAHIPKGFHVQVRVKPAYADETHHHFTITS